MAKVRCRVSCVSVEKAKGWGKAAFVWNAKFQASIQGSEADKKLLDASPASRCQIASAVQGTFVVGKDYYLDISDVSDAPAASSPAASASS